MIMHGAVMAFESDHAMTMDGIVGPAVWKALLRAAARDNANHHGYTYAVASQHTPEYLTVWHNGRIILHTLANTGIPAAPTTVGTAAVYLKYSFQIMKGHQPGRLQVRRPGVLGLVLPRRARPCTTSRAAATATSRAWAAWSCPWPRPTTSGRT